MIRPVVRAWWRRENTKQHFSGTGRLREKPGTGIRQDQRAAEQMMAKELRGRGKDFGESQLNSQLCGVMFLKGFCLSVRYEQ